MHSAISNTMFYKFSKPNTFKYGLLPGSAKSKSAQLLALKSFGLLPFIKIEK
jgi:hypothetical protein